MNVEDLDKRIERLQREQAIVGSQFDQLSSQIRQSQTRYAQITGAIDEAKYWKTQLNGTQPQ